LQQLAAQTELAPGAGRIVAASVLAPAVGWKVNVASPTDAREARALLYKLSAAGYSAEVLPVVVKGRQHHRVRITGLADRREATELAGRLGGKFVAGKPWVTPD
jgi:cell division septation protein DedD